MNDKFFSLFNTGFLLLVISMIIVLILIVSFCINEFIVFSYNKKKELFEKELLKLIGQHSNTQKIAELRNNINHYQNKIVKCNLIRKIIKRIIIVISFILLMLMVIYCILTLL